VAVFKTSAIAALALLLTSHAEAQESVKVRSDSPGTAQLRWTPDSLPIESGEPNAQSGRSFGVPTRSMIGFI
jgi:hypothetical protein